MRPVIGITVGRSSNSYGQQVVQLTQAYLEAVTQAGGAPVLIPYIIGPDGWEAIYERLDGILFSGGGDISPKEFGGDAHPRIGDVQATRDSLELHLLGKAAEHGKPFLGICRGCQLLNVGLGGNLYTHIPDQVKGALVHDNPGNTRHYLAHEVRLDEGTHVGEIMGQPLLGVNSHHHQGLQNLGTGLRVAGRSPDGLVEAIELPQHPFGMAVQWHPEWLTDQEPTRRLFRGLIQAATRTGH
jgi:putative glutamine amidotransferase